MEPLLPADPKRELADLAIEVLRKSEALGAQLREPTRSSVADLLRPMNSYYSNLIEGHSTHPIDIERALRADFGGDAKKRQLQQEGLRASAWGRRPTRSGSDRLGPHAPPGGPCMRKSHQRIASNPARAATATVSSSHTTRGRNFG